VVPVTLEDHEALHAARIDGVDREPARYCELVDVIDDEALARQIAVAADAGPPLDEKMLGRLLALEPEVEHVGGLLDRPQRDRCVTRGSAAPVPNEVGHWPPL